MTKNIKLFKKNTNEEKISQEFRLKNTDETKNYFIEEIEKNELISKKHKNILWYYIIFRTYLY